MKKEHTIKITEETLSSVAADTDHHASDDRYLHSHVLFYQ